MSNPADVLPIKKVLVGMYSLAAVSITLLGHQVPTEALFVLNAGLPLSTAVAITL